MVKQTLIVPLVALALAAGVALAHPSAGSSTGPGMAWGTAHHHPGADLAKLKAQLKITSSQEGAWENFAQAMTAMRPSGPMQHASSSSTSAPLPAPQVFSMMAQHAQDFAAKAQNLSSAAAGLYQVLTPTQQAAFNAHLAEMHARMQHRHHHWKKMHKSPAPATSGAQ